MASRFSIEAVFKALDNFSAPVRRIQRVSDRAMRGIGGAAKLAESGMIGAARAAQRLAFAATAAVGATSLLLKNIVDTGAQFESTMVAAAAKFSPAIRQGTAEFAALNAAAEKVGATTEFNAQQAAAALKDLASAGFKPAQAIAALPGVVDLATAAELDLAAASDMAGKSLGAFGLKVEDATQLQANLNRVSDAMARTADATSASMSGLFETITEGGPVAKSAGLALEEFLAFAGQLANVGIEGSEAGTTLKNAILSISAPTKEATKAFKRMKIDLLDANKNMRPLVDVFADIERATAKMGTGERTAVLEQIFGRIPIAGVSAILEAGTSKVAELRGELDKAGGSVARMAGIMRDKTAGDIDSFTSAIDGVKIAIFGVIKGPLRDILQRTTKWIDANRELVAGGVTKFLERMGATFKAVAPFVQRFFAGFGSKFDLTGTVDGISTGFDRLLETIQSPEFEAMATRWGERLGVVADAAVQIGGAILDVIPSLMLLSDAMQRPIDKVREIAAGGLGKGVGFVFGLLGKGAGGLAKFIHFAVSMPGRVLSAVSAAFAMIGAVFTRLKEIAMPAIEFVVGLAVIGAGLLQAIWEPIGEFFGELWEGISDVASAVWAGIVDVVSNEYERLKAIWSPLGEFFGGIFQSVVDFFQPAWQSIADFAGDIYDQFTSIWSGIVDFFDGLWTSVSEAFMEKFGAIIAQIESMVNFVQGVGRAELSGGGGEQALRAGAEHILPPMRGAVNDTMRIVVEAKGGANAEVPEKPKAKGTTIAIQPSGTF